MIKIWFDKLLKKSIWFQVLVFSVLIMGIIIIFFVLGSIIKVDWSSTSTNKLNEIIYSLDAKDSETIVRQDSISQKSIIILPDSSSIVINPEHINNIKQNQSINWKKVKSQFTYIFSRLIDTGSINDSEAKAFATIISVIGWILCSGLLIAVITNAYFERIKKIERGQVRYKSKNHCVIIGSHDIYLNIIRKIRAGDHESEGLRIDCKILIFSITDTRDLQNNMKAFLDPKEEKNVLIYHGNRESEDHLKTLCLRNASAIFILGEKNELGCDSKNITSVNTIVSTILKSGEPKKPIPCFLMLKELKNFELLMENSNNGDTRNILDLSYFNSNDSWTSVIFTETFVGFKHMKDKMAISYGKGETDIIRFIIIGFNRMGQSLLNQAIRTLHLNPNKKVIISVIDINAKEHLEYYLSTKPGLQTEYYDSALMKNRELIGNVNKHIPNMSIEVIKDNIESQAFRHLIKEWASSNTMTIMGVAVCFADPTMSLYDGLAISKLLEQEVPVLIRQNELHGIAETISNSDDNRKIFFFGLYDDCAYFFKEREERAKKIHDEYQRYSTILNEALGYRLNNKNWQELDEGIKWSNRFKSESMPFKKAVIKIYYNIETDKEFDNFVNDLNNFALKLLENVDSTIVKKSIIDNISEENKQQFITIELLAEMEHNRWIAEKIISGWDYANIKTQDKTRKLHPEIKAYGKLLESSKMYDRGGFL